LRLCGRHHQQKEVTVVADEALRLATLREYRILDTPPEGFFDRLVRAAALLLAAPICVISLVDEKRVWFKARYGIETPELPRELAFCGHALQTRGAALVITDACTDPRFAANPHVTGDPHLRSYIGVWLVAPNGLPIGTLCVLDHLPRLPPTAQQIAGLTDLAALAMEAIEQRSATRGTEETARVNRLVAERLHDTQRGLLHAYRARSEFFASLSHELRTPLNAVIGYADLIATDTCPPLLVAGHAEAISEAGRHMLTLVNDILEFSRLEAGEMPFAWQHVGVQRTVEEALRMVGAFARAHNVRLRQEIRSPEAMVRGDPVRLKQVLLNLATNAIKFTPPGGEVRVRLQVTTDALVMLEVADSGIGIATSDISKALTPFGQIVPQDGMQREGTGLGLPIARALIERHGGSLTIESVQGRGTTVRIVLPALSTPPLASP
jgi:signal transduction histidine kinase